MRAIYRRRIYWVVGILCWLCSMPLAIQASVKGIYVTQSTLENTRAIRYLIRGAKAAGVDTFVIDFYRSSKRTRANIQLVKNAGLHYVARIVMFPGGASSTQINSDRYLQQRYRQIAAAIELGAEKIQLDYIRFKISQRQASANAQLVHQVIQKIYRYLQRQHIGLEVDIFGEAASMESKAIGQSAPLFATAVNAICPMVYPSHYFPYDYHAVRPYKTIYRSLSNLRARLKDYPAVKIYAYIELFNFRFPLLRSEKIHYIQEEMRAVQDAHADGWYAWSAGNRYRLLFYVMNPKAVH